MYLDVHRCFFASVVLILLLARSATGELSTLINEVEALVTVEVDEDVLFDEVHTEVHELSNLDRVDNLNFIFDSVQLACTFLDFGRNIFDLFLEIFNQKSNTVIESLELIVERIRIFYITEGRV